MYTQLCYLHTLLTIDALLFDEFGQASAKQVKTLDILLCKVHNVHTRLNHLQKCYRSGGARQKVQLKLLF